jgi:LysM repeat protein
VLLAVPPTLNPQADAPAPPATPTAPPGPAAPPVSTVPAEAAPQLQLVSHHKPHPNRKIKRYRVRPGDTPSSIAVRYHAWTKQLIKINHSSVLYVGDVIKIPVVVEAAHACTRHKNHRTGLHDYHPKTHTKKAHKSKHHKAKPDKKKDKKHRAKDHAHKKRHHHAGHHHKNHHGWTHSNASRAEVRGVIIRTANRHDVNPNLALAIAWQESGWQQHRLSSAGAVGTMQVMPSTGRWMSLLVGRRLHLRDLHDNVTAGVVLIGQLRSQARYKRAIAGYYQGLGGVRRYGMYESTKQYVANVLHIKKNLVHGWNPA